MGSGTGGAGAFCFKGGGGIIPWSLGISGAIGRETTASASILSGAGVDGLGLIIFVVSSLRHVSSTNVTDVLETVPSDLIDLSSDFIDCIGVLEIISLSGDWLGVLNSNGVPGGLVVGCFEDTGEHGRLIGFSGVGDLLDTLSGVDLSISEWSGLVGRLEPKLGFNIPSGEADFLESEATDLLIGCEIFSWDVGLLSTGLDGLLDTEVVGLLRIGDLLSRTELSDCVFVFNNPVFSGVFGIGVGTNGDLIGLGDTEINGDFCSCKPIGDVARLNPPPTCNNLPAEKLL